MGMGIETAMDVRLKQQQRLVEVTAMVTAVKVTGTAMVMMATVMGALPQLIATINLATMMTAGLRGIVVETEMMETVMEMVL